MRPMLVIVLIVPFPEHRPREIELFVAAPAYLALTWKRLRIRLPCWCCTSRVDSRDFVKS